MKPRLTNSMPMCEMECSLTEAGRPYDTDVIRDFNSRTGAFSVHTQDAFVYNREVLPMEITCVSALSGSTITDKVNVSMRTKLQRNHTHAERSKANPSAHPRPPTSLKHKNSSAQKRRSLQTAGVNVPDALNNCQVSLFGQQSAIPSYTYIIGVDEVVVQSDLITSEPQIFTVGGADDCAGLENADLTYTATQ